MKVWITRAEPGASRTAARVAALGHEPLVWPLLEVRALAGEVDLTGIEALAFTSANAVEAFAGRCPDRTLPVFAVGGATARAARAAGFADVTSADGDVEALAALIVASRTFGPVLAPGPREPAGDLTGALAAAGVAARVQALYETRFTDIKPPPAAEIVLLHSPKAARRLAAVLPEAVARRLAAICISQAVAAPLAGLALACTAVAARPGEDSLLALLPGVR